MPRPELPLVHRAQRRVGRLLGLRVDGVHREMPEHHPDVVAVLLPNAFEQGVRAPQNGHWKSENSNHGQRGVVRAGGRVPHRIDRYAEEFEQQLDVVLRASAVDKRVARCVAVPPKSSPPSTSPSDADARPVAGHALPASTPGLGYRATDRVHVMRTCLSRARCPRGRRSATAPRGSTPRGGRPAASAGATRTPSRSPRRRATGASGAVRGHRRPAPRPSRPTWAAGTSRRGRWPTTMQSGRPIGVDAAQDAPCHRVAAVAHGFR